MPVKSLRFLNVGSRSANNRWLISPVQCRGSLIAEWSRHVFCDHKSRGVDRGGHGGTTDSRSCDPKRCSGGPDDNRCAGLAADLVSEKAATFLVEYARKYRQTIAAAAVVLEEFAHALTTGADKYATAEADNIKTFS